MKVVLLHGMSFHYQKEGFGPMLIKCLHENNINFNAPQMPLGHNVSYKSWKPFFKKLEREINEKTIVVAHSLSAIYLPKFLSEANLKPYAIITIAGAKKHQSVSTFLHPLKNFLPQKNHFDYVKENLPNKFSFYSNGDHLFSIKELQEYAKSMNAEQIFLKDHGHFGRKSGITNFTELNQLILNLSKCLILQEKKEIEKAL